MTEMGWGILIGAGGMLALELLLLLALVLWADYAAPPPSFAQALEEHESKARAEGRPLVLVADSRPEFELVEDGDEAQA